MFDTYPRGVINYISSFRGVPLQDDFIICFSGRQKYSHPYLLPYVDLGYRNGSDKWGVRYWFSFLFVEKRYQPVFGCLVYYWITPGIKSHRNSLPEIVFPVDRQTLSSVYAYEDDTLVF